MTSLSQQLQTIRQAQRSLQVAPNQAQPTLILSTHLATTTSPDLIYTLAVIAYSRLLKDQPNIKQEGESVMSADHRELNRNTLTKDINRGLSEKLIRFMLKISPYFMSQDCQKVLEYLLHNYKVNVFEAEALAIIYLQYWNTALYRKLISNIPPKILNAKLPFLSKVNSDELINITFIVKSLSYSHYLMSSLTMYTLQYIKQQGRVTTGMDIEINLGQDYEEPSRAILSADPRKFLLQIFTQFMNRKMTSCYKYILQFCGKAISSHSTSSQTCSMIMLLSTRLFIEGSLSQQFIHTLTSKLIKASKIQEKILKYLFDFILIIWQRKPSCVKKETIDFLEKSKQFQQYLANFKSSLWMILIDLISRWSSGCQCPILLNSIGHRIKRDQFYILYKDALINKLFSEFEKIIEAQQQPSSVYEFFQKHYQHQLAAFYHHKKIDRDTLKIAISKILPKKTFKYTKSGELHCNLEEIPIQINEQNDIKPPSEIVQSEEEEDQIKEPENVQEKEKHSLLVLLQRKGLKLSSIRFEDQATRSKLLQLVTQYYQDQQLLTSQQKNHILQKYIDIYTANHFNKDLQKRDFILPIKYLSINSDLSLAQLAINLLVVDVNLIDDVLYRELLRICLSQIASSMGAHYKTIVYYLNTFFKKMIAKYLGCNEGGDISKLSEILTKISEETFGKFGTKRGKYHKIIHNHGKIIAELIIGLKTKRRVTKQLYSEQQLVLDHYLRIIKAYGLQNLYLLNIAIIQIITRKDIDHGHIRYFLTKILLGGIKSSAFDFHDLSLSLAKSIVFCSQLGYCLKLNEEEVEPMISSGIAKKTIVEFYGLIKQKFKRVMIKKMMLYIRSVFQNSYIVQTFKLELVELDEERLDKLLHLYTQFYRILTMVQSEDSQVLQFRQKITQQITSLFPLELQLALFGPLLPNQHLYDYLGAQLEEHAAGKTQFDKLSELMNILPEEVSFEWIKFFRECLKRGFKPSQNLVQSILAKIDFKQSLSTFAQLICDISQYDPQILYAHLPVAIKVFEKHCEQPNDFTLALIAKLINNLGEMIEPYLNTLVMASINVESEFTQQFISQITSHLTTATLIKFIKENYKKTQNISNFSMLFKETVIKGVGDSLNKTLLSHLNGTLTLYLQNEENPQSILRLQCEIFLQIALKMNEHQLRKFIIDLVRWSEMKSEIEEDLPFNYRKLAVAQIFCLLSQSLQSLFNPFYGYIFESVLKDYQNIAKMYENKEKSSISKDIKRQRETNKDHTQSVIQLYLGLSLKSLEMLFKNDSEHEFMDSVKTDAFGDPLCDLLLLSQIERFGALVQAYLTPCLIAFHASIADDYQMKTINYKILIILKRKNSRLHRYIFELFDGLIDNLQDRFLLLVSDLVPFLLEGASSRQEGVAKTVRRIIGKIEDLSGQQIANYTK